MNISDQGLDLIKHFEGCKLKAYVCPAGVLTIGYGSTGPHVKADMVITMPEAEELLRKDLVRFEQGVGQAVAVGTQQEEFDAMVALAFNIGIGAFTGSTLLKMHNQGRHGEAAQQFGRWNKAGGKVLPGLVKRRSAECALYQGENWRKPL